MIFGWGGWCEMFLRFERMGINGIDRRIVFGQFIV